MTDKTVPPPPPELVSPPKWAADTMAQKEERLWPDEEKLKGQRTKNDLLWLQAYGILVVGVTIFFTLLFLASLGIWAFHFLMPVGYGWLNPDQLSKIQSIVFSGSLGAIVATVLQKQLAK